MPDQPILSSPVTLRDLFAGFALAGLLSRPGPLNGAEDVTDAAFEAADLMLQKREQK